MRVQVQKHLDLGQSAKGQEAEFARAFAHQGLKASRGAGVWTPWVLPKLKHNEVAEAQSGGHKVLSWRWQRATLNGGLGAP